MNIGEVAGAVTAALNLAKDLFSFNKAYSEADLKLKIAELTTALAGAQIGLTEVQKEMQAKDKQIDDLKKSFALRTETVELHGYKYRKTDEGKPIGFAFCPRCEQNEGKMFQLTLLNKPGRPYGCPQCKSEYLGGVTHYYQT